GQVAADGAVEEFEGRNLESEATVVDASTNGVAAVATGGAGAAERLVVDDGRVGDGGGAAAFVGETAAPAHAAVAANAAAARGPAGAALGRAIHDGTVADRDGAKAVEDAA